jgi:hypothetical protein
MELQKYKSKLIFGLLIMFGFWLIGLKFVYFMGREDGFIDAVNAMISYIPTGVAIMIIFIAAGLSIIRKQKLPVDQN